MQLLHKWIPKGLDRGVRSNLVNITADPGVVKGITNSCQAYVLLLNSIICCHCQRQNAGLASSLTNAIGMFLVFCREYRHTYTGNLLQNNAEEGSTLHRTSFY